MPSYHPASAEGWHRQCTLCHYWIHTVLSRFLAHAPLSERVPLLEYRRMRP